VNPPAPGGNSMVVVRLQRAGRTVRSYEIVSDAFTIGSAATSDIRTAGDSTIKPKHASVYVEDGECTLVPEPGATVQVNGESVDFAVLGPEDLVRIGKLTFKIELLQSPEAVARQSADDWQPVPQREASQQPPTDATVPAMRLPFESGKGGSPSVDDVFDAEFDSMLEELASEFDEDGGDPAGVTDESPVEDTSTSSLSDANLITSERLDAGPELTEAGPIPGVDRAPVLPATEELGPVLVVHPPEGPTQRIMLPQGGFFIGQTGSHIVMPFAGVAQRHALLGVYADGSVAVQDQGSGQPTMLNGTAVSHTYIRPGDVLQVGPVHFTLEAPPTALAEAGPEALDEYDRTEPGVEPIPVADLETRYGPPPRSTEAPVHWATPRDGTPVVVSDELDVEPTRTARPVAATIPEAQADAEDTEIETSDQKPAPEPYPERRPAAPEPPPAPAAAAAPPEPAQPDPAPWDAQPAPAAPTPQPQPAAPTPPPQPAAPTPQPQAAAPAPEPAAATPPPQAAAAPAPAEPQVVVPDDIPADDEFAAFYFGEDEDDETAYVEPFDLAQELLERPPPAVEGPREAYCAAHVLRVVDGRVAEAAGVLPSKPYRSTAGDLDCRLEGGRLTLRTPVGAGGWIHQGGEQAVDMAAVPAANGVHSAVLADGHSALIATSAATYKIEVYKPPKPVRFGGFGASPLFFAMIFGAAIIHLVVGVAVAAVQPKGGKQAEVETEEVFAEVNMEEPPVDQPPEPPKIEEDATAMAEKAPEVTQRTVNRVKENPKTTNTSVANVLNVLNPGTGAAGESTDLKDLVSNVDAVDGGTALGGFNIAGAIGALGDDVNVARSGGGGDISTMSGDDVAGDAAALADGERGNVRGKVTKMSSELKVQGSLDRSEVTRVVNQHIHQIQACYERELLNEPDISGRIVFDWTVTESGGVKDVRVRSSTLGNAAVADCIAALIKKWKFAQPEGGEVIITYPFLFRSVSS